MLKMRNSVNYGPLQSLISVNNNQITKKNNKLIYEIITKLSAFYILDNKYKCTRSDL